MKNITKKVVVLLLVFTLIIPFASGLYVEASTEKEWEFNNKSLKAVLDETVLTISPLQERNVSMNDFTKAHNASSSETYFDTPWREYNDKIKTVVIEKGVSSLGEGAFKECKNLERINILGDIISGSTAAIPLKDGLIIRIYGELGNSNIKSFINNNSTLIKKEVLVDISEKNDNSVIALYKDENCYISGTGLMKDNVRINCKNLIIEEGVEHLSDLFCSGDSPVEYVTIANSVKSIGAYSWYGSGVKEVDIKNDSIAICSNAFLNCKNLTIKTNSRSSASAYAKANNINCQIKNANTLISESWDISAAGDGSLTAKLTYRTGKSCEFIISGTGAMKDWSIGDEPPWYQPAYREKVESIWISSGVTNIGAHAFNGFSNVTTIQIPDTVTSISDYAFAMCSNLTYIYIPKTVTSIAGNAFEYHNNGLVIAGFLGTTAENYAKGKEGISFKNVNEFTNLSKTGDTIKALLSEDGTLTITGKGDMKNWYPSDSQSKAPWTLDDYREKVLSVTIEHGITNIGSYAFYLCNNLKKVTIADTVTSFSANAFNSCMALTNVTIPDAVTSIPEGTFSLCKNLTVTIPDSVREISDTAFQDCSAGLVIKGFTKSYAKQYATDNHITFISLNNWYDDEIRAEGSTLTANLDYNTGTLTIDGTGAMKSFNYVEHAPWHGIKGIQKVVIGKNVTTIGCQAFEGMYDLKEVEIQTPSALKTIETLAFNNCTNLEKITIPDGVEEIQIRSFDSCHKLKSITIPESVTSIGEAVFNNCTDSNNPITIKGFTDSAADTYCKKTENDYLTFKSLNYWKDDEIGEEGSDLTANLDYDTGILTINGTGAMKSFDSVNHAPWYGIRGNQKGSNWKKRYNNRMSGFSEYV